MVTTGFLEGKQTFKKAFPQDTFSYTQNAPLRQNKKLHPHLHGDPRFSRRKYCCEWFHGRYDSRITCLISN